MRRIEVLTYVLVLVAVLSTSSFSAASFPISVIDDREETIVIDARPERIIAVNALYAEIVIDLGAFDRLIAVADSPDNPGVTSSLPSVGPTYAFNVELTVGLEPDLVLGATDWGGERPALEAVGITVFTTPLLVSVPDIFSSINSIAAAIGSDAEGAALIGRIAREIVDAEALVLGASEIKAAFLYAGDSGGSTLRRWDGSDRERADSAGRWQQRLRRRFGLPSGRLRGDPHARSAGHLHCALPDREHRWEPGTTERLSRRKWPRLRNPRECRLFHPSRGGASVDDRGTARKRLVA